MVGLTRWSPFGPVFQLHREIDELFKQVFDVAAGSATTRVDAVPVAWWPAVESYAKDGQIHVRVALPGVDPKDVEVTVADDCLTIRGERKASSQERQGGYFVREFATGAFERALALPEGIDASKVHARFANGMLELTMPAPLAVAPKRIAIDVESPADAAKAIKAA